jgi:hypothetical protein
MALTNETTLLLVDRHAAIDEWGYSAIVGQGMPGMAKQIESH